MMYIYPKTKPYISIPVGIDAYIKRTSLTDDKITSAKQTRRQQQIDSLDKLRGKKC